jgi:hypothetical protein
MSDQRWTDNQAELDQLIAAMLRLGNRLANEKADAQAYFTAMQDWQVSIAKVAESMPEGAGRTELGRVADDIAKRLEDGPPGPGSNQQRDGG